MPTNSGGAAAAAGTDYQARVSAWACALMLSETVPPWEWPAGTLVQTVQCESGHDVNDVAIVGDSATAYVQAKHRVTLETAPGTPLGKAVAQFVRQFLARDGWPRDDRLLLVTSTLSSRPITVDLPRILEQVRDASAATSISEILLSDRHRGVLNKVTQHISTAYADATHHTLDERTLLEVLRCIRILVLDLEMDGAGERESLLLLRSALPSQVPVESVWSTLVSHCVRLMRTRGSETPASMRDFLRAHGWAAHAEASYQADVQQLVQESDVALAALRDLSTIDGEHVVRSVDQALVDRARRGSFLLTGEPGADKSGSLWSLASAMRLQGPVVLLRADTISAQSSRQLREDLELRHPPEEVLARWPSTHTGLLIIDALDAARGPSQRVLQDFIERAVKNLPNWTVVVSIRRFDLQYNQVLKRLFHTDSPSVDEYSIPEFSAVAHMTIPALSYEELELFATVSAAVAAVLDELGNDPLLLSPFNLRIIAGLPREAIETGFTQDDLLDAYWSDRVLADGSHTADRYETVLRRACNAMIAGGRLLVDRSELTVDELGAGTLSELLSRGILAEVGPPEAPRRRIAFSHHVLFDFAVSELVLSESSVDDLLGGEHGLILRIRPSLQFWFRKLWHRSNDRFWQITLRWQELEGFASARLIPAQVAVNGLTSLQQLEPLLTHLAAPTNTENAAQRALRTIVQAAVADGEEHIRAGTRSEIWAALADRLVTVPDEQVALATRLLFWELAKTRLSGTAAMHAASAARGYFTWAITAGKHGEFWLRQAIQIIVATFALDPAASETCLRVLTSADRLSEHGFEEAPVLARALADLGPDAADFVADAYVSILGHEESSSEPTVMHSGVLSLSSNRRQDYAGAISAIEDAYPSFLANSPAQGLRVALEMWRHRTERRQSHPRDAIALPSAGGAVIPDSSYFIDFEDSHEEAIQILAHLRAWIGAQTSTVTVGVIDQLTVQRVHMGVWAAVLQAAPRTQGVAHALLPILTNAECLASAELSPWIGDAIVDMHAAATVSEQVAIEQTLIAMGRSGDERRSRIADGLLARFEPDALETAEARGLRGDLDVDQTPPYLPRGGWRAFDTGPEDPHSDLREAGVDTDEPLTRRVLGLARDLESELPTTLDRETFDSRVGVLRQLTADQANLAVDGSAEVKRTVLHSAATFAAAAARAEWIADVDLDTRQLLVGVVLESLEIPVSHPREVESFDESSHWAGGNPRITAVQAVFGLVHYGIATSEIESQVAALCAAPEVEVRLQAFQCLPWIVETRRSLASALVQTGLGIEPSATVLEVILRVAFQDKRFTDRDGLLANIRQTLSRARRMGHRGRRLKESCTRKLAILDIWDADPSARTEIDSLLRGIPGKPKLISAVIHTLREPLTPAPYAQRLVAARIRAVEIATEVVQKSSAELARLRARFERRQASASARKRYRRLLEHVDAVSNQLYFACGAYVANGEAPNEYADPHALLRHYRPVLEALVGATAPSTTHHTIEVLVYGFDADPRTVLRLVASAVEAGTIGGYEFDPMGLDLVMSFLRRFVAEQRDVLRTDPQVLADFLRTLDTFVDVGWGSAHNLSYSLDEVFR
ncbi:hypothetical protein [Microbacterium lacticum]